MVNLDIQKQNDIKGQGYGIQLVGLDTHFLPLYLHQDRVSDKNLGDVFIKFKISNPKTGPNNAEKDYLSRKGSRIGIYAWKPGADCLAKEFTNVKYVQDLQGGGTRVVKLEPDHGCRWCRERPAQTSSRYEAEAESAFEAEPATEVAPPSPNTILACSQCTFVPKLKTKNGVPFSAKQRENMIRLHAESQHKQADTSSEVPVSTGVGED